MITGIEITKREPLAGGATFGATGAYERVEGIATGRLDPAHSANAVIAGIGLAPRDADGFVTYRTSFILFRPADPMLGNGRLLYEVNNRGRIMILANLCAGPAGNDPRKAEDLGNALPLRLGFSMLWSGWDAAVAKSTGLWLEIPVLPDVSAPARDEFVSGTRLGVHESFRLSHDAVRVDSVTVRRTQTGERTAVPFTLTDKRVVSLLPEGTKPTVGSIYEIRYQATNGRPHGIGFAATRDLISHVRTDGKALTGRPVTHTLAFGISQAGRYLRDHIALGFNADETGARVFDGVQCHVAGIGRVFLNDIFAQPFRTRTWHEDHDFPEVEFPFSADPQTDPISGRKAGLLRGDASDPKLIETNTSTEYWQKGASLLHTTPDGTANAWPKRSNARFYLIAGTQHGGKAGMPRDAGPCVNPRNWHDPMPVVRALLVALDEWVVSGREPPASDVPSVRAKTLVPARDSGLVGIPGLTPPRDANDVAPLLDWVDPRPPAAHWTALVPRVGDDGNEVDGIRLPDIAVPLGTFTGWNLYAEPWPAGTLADRDGTFLAFAATKAEREAAGDPRPSLEERYPTPDARAARVRAVVESLFERRLLLHEDAEAYLA